MSSRVQKFDTTVDPFGGEAWEVIRDGVRDNALAVFGNRMHVVDGRFLYVPGGVTYKSWGSTLPYFFDIVNNNDAGSWTMPPLLFDTGTPLLFIHLCNVLPRVPAFNYNHDCQQDPQPNSRHPTLTPPPHLLLKREQFSSAGWWSRPGTMASRACSAS